MLSNQVKIRFGLLWNAWSASSGLGWLKMSTILYKIHHLEAIQSYYTVLEDEHDDQNMFEKHNVANILLTCFVLFGKGPGPGGEDEIWSK